MTIAGAKEYLRVWALGGVNLWYTLGSLHQIILLHGVYSFTFVYLHFENLSAFFVPAPAFGFRGQPWLNEFTWSHPPHTLRGTLA